MNGRTPLAADAMETRSHHADGNTEDLGAHLVRGVSSHATSNSKSRSSGTRSPTAAITRSTSVEASIRSAISRSASPRTAGLHDLLLPAHPIEFIPHAKSGVPGFGRPAHDRRRSSIGIWGSVRRLGGEPDPEEAARSTRSAASRTSRRLRPMPDISGGHRSVRSGCLAGPWAA